MKQVILTAICLLVSTAAYSQQPLVSVRARYEGFDLSKYTEIIPGPPNEWKTRKPKGRLSAPHVVTKSGQRAKLEVIREVPLPKSPSGESRTSAGITLELLPVIKDGHIEISGKSIVRRTLPQATPQPIHSISFSTRETYFNCVVNNGDLLTLAIGDGPKDKAHIILEVKLIDASGRQVQLANRNAPLSQ